MLNVKQTARDIFENSESGNYEVFIGFPIQMPENLTLALKRQPVREQDDVYVLDQPHQGFTIIMDENTHPTNIFHYFLLMN